jgi:hypothetical protein
LGRFGPIWADLGRFGPIWADLGILTHNLSSSSLSTAHGLMIHYMEIDNDPHCTAMRVSRGWGLRCRWESLQSGNKDRAFQIMIYSKLSLDFLPLWSRFWEFWANNLKLRLQLNHVPVHKTHSAKVRTITTTSKTPSLNRIE